MQKINAILGTVAVSLGLALGLAGCPEEQGPMEKTGEAMDEAAEEVEEVFDDDPLENAGEKVDEAAEEAKEGAEEAME